MKQRIVYQRGFGLIDSMIALGVLSLLTIGGISYFNKQQSHKNAENLANQTREYAILFSKNTQLIMRDNIAKEDMDPRADGLHWRQQVITINVDEPNVIAGIAKKNIFGQTPCITMIKDNQTNTIAAIMYYVGGKSFNTPKDIDLLRSASAKLGGVAGIYQNGQVIGNGGWSVPSNSPLLTNSNKCGGAIANNSLVINLELLPTFYTFSQHILQLTLISAGRDDNTKDMEKPGHMQNYNTVATNLSFKDAANSTIDNPGILVNSANSLKLNTKIAGNSKKSFGFNKQDANTVLHAGYLQATGSAKAGDSCRDTELGQVVMDKGTSSALTSSTLTCVASFTCPNSVNNYSYCYRPSLLQDVVLTNNTDGVQSNGQFKCPSVAPFIKEDGTNSNVNSYADIYVGVNAGATFTSSTIWGYVKTNQSGSVMSIINKSPSINYNNWETLGSPKLMQLTDSNIANPLISNISLGSLAYTLTPIFVDIGGATAKIGYTITQSSPINCTAVCGKLDTLLGNQWRVLGGADPSVISTINNGCACERVDFSYNNTMYNGVAIVKMTGGKLLGATCTNQPTFNEY